MTQTVPDGLHGKTYCSVARDLLDQYAAAVKRVLELEGQHLEAVISGNPEADLSIPVNEAGRVRRQAKYAYLKHLHDHGCSTAPNDVLRDEGVE